MASQYHQQVQSIAGETLKSVDCVNIEIKWRENRDIVDQRRPLHDAVYHLSGVSQYHAII